MSGAGSGFVFYSFTFSPDGRLFQVEYATKAVDKESLTIAVKCSDGILFAVEKNLSSPLLASRSNQRVYLVSPQIGCATVGYRPDCYAAVVETRKECANYYDNFGVDITVPELVSRMASYFHQTHGFSSERPYGCTLIFGAVENKKPVLYAIEPNGQFFGYYACCFGKGGGLARTELQNTNWEEKTVLEAIPIVSDIIRGLHESNNKKWEIEMVWICEQSGGKPKRVPDNIFVPEQKIEQ